MISCLIFLAMAYIALLTTPSFATTFEESDGCKIYDITQPIRNNMASFDSNIGAGQVIKENYGRVTVTGTLVMSTHVGTHVDAPSHIFKKLLNRAGFKVDSLDLKTLVGPVLVVETPKDSNITTQVLESLHIPEGTERVIFKTSNTDNSLMDKQEFVGNYTGFTKDGAKWLVKNTRIKFVGIDYMSVAIKDKVYSVYKRLLKGNSIIPVENLKLDGIEPGPYNVYCLPLRLIAEAAPVRCVLVNTTCPMENGY